MNERNEGWEALGKATAWIVGLGVAGTGIYYGGKALYDSGYENGVYSQGLPENCLRFTKEQTNDPGKFGTVYNLAAYGNCKGLYVTIPAITSGDFSQDSNKESRTIDVILGNTKVDVSNKAPYATVQRYNAGWNAVE